MGAIDWRLVGEWFVGMPLRITLVILLAFVLRWVVHRAIRGVERRALGRTVERNRVNRVLAGVAGVDMERRRQRTTTMASVLRSVSSIVILTIALLTVMAELGLPLGPLLASAGIGGVAVGFGAQSLVKDFLSGIFMIVEDQYGVGDVIDTGQAIGTVEEVTLRVTRLRDGEGVVWFIRNGEILRIGNMSQGWALGTIDIPIATTEDPTKVIPLLEKVAADAFADQQWEGVLLEKPTVAGVESVGPGAITLRMFAKTTPGQQWGVQRYLRQRAITSLDAAGVEVAPPHVPQVG